MAQPLLSSSSRAVPTRKRPTSSTFRWGPSDRACGAGDRCCKRPFGFMHKRPDFIERTQRTRRPMADQEAKLDCEAVLKHRFEHLDCELVSVKSAQVDRHLADCRACFSRAEFERKLLGLVR